MSSCNNGLLRSRIGGSSFTGGWSCATGAVVPTPCALTAAPCSTAQATSATGL